MSFQGLDEGTGHLIPASVRAHTGKRIKDCVGVERCSQFPSSPTMKSGPLFPNRPTTEDHRKVSCSLPWHGSLTGNNLKSQGPWCVSGLGFDDEEMTLLRHEGTKGLDPRRQSEQTHQGPSVL